MASASITELTEENICKFCYNALGKYTCPKCNITYCCLACYQSEKHLQCSEIFYKDCIMQNLSVDASEDSKTKMLEILKKMHDENVVKDENNFLDSDDEEYLDLGERLAGINLDDTEKVWEKLTSDERQEFEAFLRSGDVSKLVKQWEPWWSYQCQDKVLDLSKFEKIKRNCPKIKANIKDFTSITKKSASSIVHYNLINILTAYVFTLRYFNGEHRDHILETVACISKLSLNLHKNQNFENSETAIISVEQQCLNINWIYTDEENIKLMKEDIHRLLQGPHSTEKKFYIFCALSDLCSIFNASLKVDDKKGYGGFAKAFPQSKFPEVELENKEVVKRHVKKIEFSLSFVKDILYL